MLIVQEEGWVMAENKTRIFSFQMMSSSVCFLFLSYKGANSLQKTLRISFRTLFRWTSRTICLCVSQWVCVRVLGWEIVHFSHVGRPWVRHQREQRQLSWQKRRQYRELSIHPASAQTSSCTHIHQAQRFLWKMMECTGIHYLKAHETTQNTVHLSCLNKLQLTTNAINEYFDILYSISLCSIGALLCLTVTLVFVCSFNISIFECSTMA